jgi:type II secretory pathway component PulF
VLVFPTGQLVDLVRQFNLSRFLLAKATMLFPLYAAAFVVLLAGQASRSEGWRALVERLLRLLPLVGSSRRSLALARLASSLGARIGAGVQIIEAWMLAADACASPALKREVRGWRRRLEAGQTPGDILTLDSSFPTLFANLYRTAEISGQLDETLERLYHHYQEEGSRKLHLLAQWLPRLVYLVILIAVAFQIVSFWTGHYDSIFRQFSE